MVEDFSLKTYSTEEDTRKEDGEFLPLGVYEKRGYDIQAIEENSEPRNIRIDPVLGKVYKVVVQSSGSRGIMGRCETWDAAASSANVREFMPLASAQQDEPDLESLKLRMQEAQIKKKEEIQMRKANETILSKLKTAVAELSNIAGALRGMMPPVVTEGSERELLSYTVCLAARAKSKA